MIALATDLTSEHDFKRMLTGPDLRLHVTRISYANPVTPGNLQMHWPEANVLLPPGRLDPGGLVPDYNATVTLEAL